MKKNVLALAALPADSKTQHSMPRRSPNFQGVPKLTAAVFGGAAAGELSKLPPKARCAKHQETAHPSGSLDCSFWLRVHSPAHLASIVVQIAERLPVGVN